MKFKQIIIFSTIFLFFAIPLFVFAAGLVPCGGQGQKACTLPCFYVMINNVITFLLWDIATPLAATALMVSGMMFLLGGSEKTISRGKTIFSSTLIGLFLAFGAWLIIDLILGNLLNPGYMPWNKFPSGACETYQPSNSNNSSSSSSSSTGNNSSSSNYSPYDYIMGITDLNGNTWEDGVETNTPEYQNYEAENDAHPEGYSLSPSSIGNANCNPALNDFIQGADLNGVDPARVKAIIQAESSGNPNAVVKDADGKYSYGLMQVRADTARIYDSSLAGKSDAEIGDKLIKDTGYNINIGTKYFSDLLKKYNGDATLAHAAYNGGPLANKPSINCPGLKRWQCEWDNNAHTIPNTGYEPTRKYIANINNYMNSCQ